jgi:glycosyltransferase involved in cell wall biosynthesis
LYASSEGIEVLIIGFDAKRAFQNTTGLGNYSRLVIDNVHKALMPEKTYLFAPNSRRSRIQWQPPSDSVVLQPIGIEQLYSTYWRSFSVAKLANKLNADVFHGLSGELPSGLSRKIKKVVTIHDLLFLKHTEFYPLLDRWAYHFKSYQACKMADLILATSEVTKQDIIRYYKTPATKIKVFYQDCSDSFYSAAKAKHLIQKPELAKKFDKYLVMVGRFELRKNQKLAIEAMKFLPSNYSLVLIGRTNDYLRRLTAQIELQKIQHRVLILNNVTNEELLGWIAHANCQLYLSSSEGFGIPILESFALETPVVLSDTPVAREIAGAAGVYAESRAESVAEAVIQLERHIDLDTMRKVSRKFNLENRMDDVRSIYD